jgi:hypothetical protein
MGIEESMVTVVIERDYSELVVSMGRICLLGIIAIFVGNKVAVASTMVTKNVWRARAGFDVQVR